MKRKKILIVEDQLIITMDLEYMLEELGYEVCGVSTNYDDAITAIKTNQPNLILIDIVLEGDKTGIDLADEINRAYHIPFIFLTSHVDRGTIEAAESKTPAGYIVKPFNRNDVYATIELAFNRNHSDAQSEEAATSTTIHETDSHTGLKDRLKAVSESIFKDAIGRPKARLTSAYAAWAH